jgi:hypothetical protein
MKDLEYLWILYLTAKRTHYKKPFIRRGKKDKDSDMEKVAKIIEDLRCDAVDYILFNIKALSTVRVFPTPAHLASNKAKARYQIHMARMGIYNTEWYYIDHNDFTVKKSYKTYDLRDVDKKGVDPDESYALFLSVHPEVGIKDSLDKIFYTEAKYHFLFKQPPDKLQTLFDKANGEVIKCGNPLL